MLCIAPGYSITCFSVRELLELAVTLVMVCALMHTVRNVLWMVLGYSVNCFTIVRESVGLPCAFTSIMCRLLS